MRVVFFDIGDTLVGKGKWLPGAKEILAKLRAAKIRIGLISNTGDLSRDKLQKLLPDDFDFADFEEGLVMLSSEVGVSKPSLAIFSLAVHHAGVQPWSTMFVGETLEEVIGGPICRDDRRENLRFKSRLQGTGKTFFKIKLVAARTHVRLHVNFRFNFSIHSTTIALRPNDTISPFHFHVVCGWRR